MTVQELGSGQNGWAWLAAAWIAAPSTSREPLGSRQIQTFAPSAAMYKYTALRGCSLVVTRDCRAGQRREGVLITARRPANMARVSVAQHG
jgi:hypothetical protein